MQQQNYTLYRDKIISIQLLGMLILSFMVSIVFATEHEIDLTQPCVNSSTSLIVTLNSAVNIDIGAISAPAGNLTWIFDSVPVGSSGVVCSPISPEQYNCSGVIVDLPAAGPASVVQLSGTPTTGDGSFNMALEASVGGTSCIREYTVDFITQFQTVFVLDRSGSMRSSSNVTAPATDRWDALKRSVINFSDPHLVNAGEVSLSELGLSFFNGSIVANTTFTNNLELITASLPSQLSTELESQSAGGSTAMGKGVENALTKFTNASIPRSILLFTDGQQNVAPFVDINGLYLNNVSRSGCIGPSADCTLIPTDINIVTIGIGQPSGDYLTTLQNLAAEHNGYSIITSSSDSFTWSTGVALGDVTAAFTSAISPALTNNSPQMVALNKGRLSGNTINTLPSFTINKYVSKLIIQISYSHNFETPQLAAFFAGIQIEKDGVNIKSYFKPTINGNFTNSINLTSNFSAKNMKSISSEGTYTIKMVKPSHTKSVNFNVVSFADDHHFDMDWKTIPGNPRVTQTFKPQMSLKWKGKPIDIANIEVSILKPGDLGTLLSEYLKNIDPSSAPDAGTAGYQKYLEAIKDPEFLASLLPNEQKLSLIHTADGKYEASYNPGDISGIYQLLYTINLDSSETGTIHRMAMQSLYVSLGDMDIDSSNVSSTVNGNSTLVTMKPISIQGKLYGPGQQNVFAFTGADVLVDNVIDNQNGGYTFKLIGDPEKDVTITVLGETIFTGPIQDFGKGGFPAWLLWLIILIIVLFLLWLIIRLLSGNSNP